MRGCKNALALENAFALASFLVSESEREREREREGERGRERGMQAILIPR